MIQLDVVPALFIGVLMGFMGCAMLMSYLQDREDRRAQSDLTWTDRAGRTTTVRAIGHNGVTVHAVSRYADGREGCYETRVWTVEECAEDAGWSITRMREYLGLPEPAALEEATVPLSEWLEERSR